MGTTTVNTTGLANTGYYATSTNAGNVGNAVRIGSSSGGVYANTSSTYARPATGYYTTTTTANPVTYT